MAQTLTGPTMSTPSNLLPAVCPELGIEVPVSSIEKELRKLWEQDDAQSNASLMNLAIYSEKEGSLVENSKIIYNLTSEHACRAILVEINDRTEEAGLRAWITAHCHLAGGKKSVCCEQIAFHLTGRVTGVDAAHRLVTVGLSGGEILVPNADVEPGRLVRLHLPERDVLVATQRPVGLSALNLLEGMIVSMEPDGEGMTRIRIACGTDVILARITALSVERLQLKPGLPVFAVIKTVALQR